MILFQHIPGLLEFDQELPLIHCGALVLSVSWLEPSIRADLPRMLNDWLDAEPSRLKFALQELPIGLVNLTPKQQGATRVLNTPQRQKVLTQRWTRARMVQVDLDH